VLGAVEGDGAMQVLPKCRDLFPACLLTAGDGPRYPCDILVLPVLQNGFHHREGAEDYKNSDADAAERS
jgi:hypothetical protein